MPDQLHYFARPSNMFLTSHLLLLFVILFALLPATNTQGHFVKDQKIDHNFPPEIPKPPKGVPAGHLRPLGYQKSAESKAKSFGPTVPPAVFFDRCILKRKPCSITDIYHPPAQTIWRDKYLAKKFGDLDFVVLVKQPTLEWSETSTKFIDFLKKYHYEDWKLQSPIYEEMKTDLTIPLPLQCPSVLQHLQFASLSLSSGPNSSPLFYESNDQLHCVLAGRADFILISEDHQNTFHTEEVPYKNSGAGRSSLNVDQVNMFEHSYVNDIPWQWATITNGSCIYVPAGHMQQIRTYGRFQSIIFSLTAPETYDNCSHDVQGNDSLSLRETRSLWKFENKQLIPTAEQWTADLAKEYMSALMSGQHRLYFKKFAHFFNTNGRRPVSELRDALDAFKEFDTAVRGSISSEQLETASKHKFDWLANVLESRRKGVPTRDEL